MILGFLAANIVRPVVAVIFGRVDSLTAAFADNSDTDSRPRGPRSVVPYRRAATEKASARDVFCRD